MSLKNAYWSPYSVCSSVSWNCDNYLKLVSIFANCIYFRACNKCWLFVLSTRKSAQFIVYYWLMRRWGFVWMWAFNGGQFSLGRSRALLSPDFEPVRVRQGEGRMAPWRTSWIHDGLPILGWSAEHSSSKGFLPNYSMSFGDWSLNGF